LSSFDTCNFLDVAVFSLFDSPHNVKIRHKMSKNFSKYLFTPFLVTAPFYFRDMKQEFGTKNIST